MGLTGAEALAAALAKTSERAFKSVQVEKHVEPYVDLGTLLLVDSDDLDASKIKSKSKEERSQYLLDLTRDNTQLLFNAVWELPTSKVDETVCVTLPDPRFALPRAQRAPKPKPLTKWEQFAKDKGITKKKKEKASWDETLQKWVPLYGYKRAAAQKDTEWAVEVPGNVDPMTDMFAEAREKKSEKVAKNELQRLKNIARARKLAIPRVGLPVTSDKATSKQLSTAIALARSSTASAGAFQPRLPKEKEPRGKEATGLMPNASRKRKAPPPADERKHNLEVVDEIQRKQPKVDLELAANAHIRQEQAAQAEENQTSRPRAGKAGKKGGAGAGPKNKKGKKPTSGKGQRNPNKRSLGRKRR